MNIERFFTSYRDQFDETLSPSQMNGLTRLLLALSADDNMVDVRWKAYLLATTKHEVANTWQPITERGSEDYFVRRYWTNVNIRQLLGNMTQEDALTYRGRGYVQLTGRRNYATFAGFLGVDLVSTPALALDHVNAYLIASIGMRHGRFTGRALGHYINRTGCDFYNARRVVNGVDRAGLIAEYAKKLLACLEEAL